MVQSRKALALALSLLFTAASLAAHADETGPREIVRALTPKPKPQLTRGLDIQGANDSPAPQADAPPPQIDLTVNFEFDSSTLTQEGVQQLAKLGIALNDPALKAFSFKIVGHTDARGDPGYNVSLSEKRAHAVGAFLSQNYSIDPARLALQGRGANELKDPNHPEAGVNRRVQVVTVTQ